MINIEWRDPLEVGNCLSHIGNKNSGRYPRGSGDRPNQHVSSARGTIKKKKKSKKEDRLAKLNKSAKSFSDVESKAQNVSSDISKAYISEAKIILDGLGADEIFGGYLRYKNDDIENQMKKDLDRLWLRNCGRDDRVCGETSIELRFPYLDFDLMELYYTFFNLCF